MCNAGCIYDPKELELDAPRVKTVKQANATTDYDRHEMNREFVEKTFAEGLLNNACPHQIHVLWTSCDSGTRDCAFDAFGDERIRGIPLRHGIRDGVRHDEQWDTRLRPTSTPCIRYIVRAAPRDVRADPARECIQDFRARG